MAKSDGERTTMKCVLDQIDVKNSKQSTLFATQLLQFLAALFIL